MLAIWFCAALGRTLPLSDPSSLITKGHVDTLNAVLSFPAILLLKFSKIWAQRVRVLSKSSLHICSLL